LLYLSGSTTPFLRFDWFYQTPRAVRRLGLTAFERTSVSDGDTRHHVSA
jgi:hypothetical protein